VAEGQLPAGNPDLRLDPQDAADLLAVNALLAQGVKVSRLEDGSVWVPRSARDQAAAQAGAHGVTFTAAPSAWRGATLADKVVVAYTGGSEVRDTLAALGFEGRAVSTTTLTTVLTDEVDVLLVGGNLNLNVINAANRAALNAFLARGGGVVGLGTAGSTFANGTALLTVSGTAAAGLASGVVNVVNHGGPIINGAIPHSFVNQPVWYSNLGAAAVVEQSYAADPLLSGWWPLTGNNGQAAAAGKASIVRAHAVGGTGLTLIGTSPVFRLHAKGLQPQLGRALLWAAAPLSTVASAESTVGGTVPATLSLSLGAPASFGAFAPGVARTYDASATARIVSTAGDATLGVTDPSPSATGHLVNGTFSLPQPLRVGGSLLPAVVKTWGGPTSNEEVTIPFQQSIGAADALRTGTYSKTLTFTLSTTNP
jgi:hypothetical protein